MLPLTLVHEDGTPHPAEVYMTATITLNDLNTLEQGLFVAVLGDVFEHSAWVARRAWRARPFANVAALHAAMTTEVERASPDEKLALLRAHPELAGREAQAGDLTPASAHEQTRAGLTALSPAEMSRITHLNGAYRLQHGFPFIVCVGLHSKHSLMLEFERRARNDTAIELHEALDQVAAIAKLRLDRLLSA